MARWPRRQRDKATASDGAKSIVIAEDLRDTIDAWGGWPFDGAYGMIYRRQPNVRTVIDFLARNVAQLTLKTYLRVDNDDRVELNDHPLTKLLRKPSPTITPYRLIYALVADKAIYDRAYWYKVDAPARALVRIPPSRMLRRRKGDDIEYRVHTGNTLVLPGYTPGDVVPRDRLVVFAGYTPDGTWNDEDGTSPMETLRRILNEQAASELNRENYWRNAARRDGVIERPLEAPDFSPQARERFRNDWENTHAGANNAGRTPILEEGMHWNPDSFSPKDSEYVLARQLARDEVALEFGVNPQLFKGESANANIESFHRFLYADTLGPQMRDICDTIHLELLPEMDMLLPVSVRGQTYTEFDLEAKLKGSPEQQLLTYVTAAGVPIMARNEARARVNLSRIDDPAFDRPITPLNVLEGGQASVNVPTDVPKPAPKARGRKKAPANAIRRRDAAAKELTELFVRYFRSQQKALKSVRSKSGTFDMDRWNGKLSGDLYVARVNLAAKTGKLAAKQIDGVYDPQVTLNYLSEGARREAERINAQTADALDAAEDDDAIEGVFAEATSSRASYLGLSTAVEIISFARHEAAVQSQRADGVTRKKTWVVTSDNSRHPEMDGEEVGLDETFSNGAMWPGDASAGVDQVAGCECLLDITS